MSEREIVIRIRLPRVPRKWWLVVGVLTSLCIGSWVFALNYNNPFSSGTPISSNTMNQYLGDLNTRITNITPATTWSWTAPSSYVNTYTPYDPTNRPVGWYKDTLGIVHLRGMLTTGSTQTNQTAFTLTAGNRPSTTQRFSVYGCVTLDIQTTGNVDINCTVAPGMIMNLDGVTFHGEN
jgi:hypothetical protein